MHIEGPDTRAFFIGSISYKEVSMNTYPQWQCLYNNRSANHASPLAIVGVSSIGLVIHWAEQHWYTGVTRTEVCTWAP
jgi:hypothetical protein